MHPPSAQIIIINNQMAVTTQITLIEVSHRHMHAFFKLVKIVLPEV
jgi:hypothetical protein